MDYINEMNPFSFPEFPSLDIDIPFDKIVSFDLPELPDLSQLSNIPETVFSSLPGLPSSITDCGMDMNCIADATGMNEVIDTIDTLQEVFDVLDIENLKRIFASILSGATCSEWEDIVLPLNDLLSRVPALGYSGNSCDVTVPICKDLDFSGSAAAISELEDILKSLCSGRRLDWGTSILSLVSNVLSAAFTFSVNGSILLQWGAPSSKFPSFNGMTGGLSFLAKKEIATEKYQPMWISTSLNPAVTIAPSFDFINGTMSITTSPGVSLSFAWNKGVKPLLKGVLENIEINQPDKMSEEFRLDETCVDFAGRTPKWIGQDSKLGERICGMKVNAISVANQEWYDMYARMPEWIKEHNKPTDLKDPTPKDCSESKMQQMVKSTSDLSTGKDFDKAFKCIQHWTTLHGKVGLLSVFFLCRCYFLHAYLVNLN